MSQANCDQIAGLFYLLALEVGMQPIDKLYPLTGADIVSYDLDHPGNAYIMPRYAYHYIRMLKDHNGDLLITHHNTGPRLLGCGIVFVDEKIFMKGVI